MKERICVHFCISFIYMWFARIIYLDKVFYLESIEQIVFCLINAIFLTILFEALHYLMIDFIKYTKIIILLFIVLSILIVYLTASQYYLMIIIYINIIFIHNLMKSYQMNHLLDEFHKTNLK